MAASVRIDPGALVDPRFTLLARAAGLTDGDHARGKLERVWALATERGSAVLDAEEIAIVSGVDGFAEHIVTAKLGKQTKSGEVRLAGSERLLWLKVKRESGRASGHKGGEFGNLGGRPPKPGKGVIDEPGDLRVENPPLALALALAPAPAPVKKKRAKALVVTDDETQSLGSVLGKLQERSGVAYRPDTDAHAKLLLRLLRSGYTEHDLRLVVWHKGNEWADDEKMRTYLRPSTLFGREKFPEYLAAAKAAYADGEERANSAAAAGLFGFAGEAAS